MQGSQCPQFAIATRTPEGRLMRAWILVFLIAGTLTTAVWIFAALARAVKERER
jgi:hypothetical protein